MVQTKCHRESHLIAIIQQADQLQSVVQEVERMNKITRKYRSLYGAGDEHQSELAISSKATGAHMFGLQVPQIHVKTCRHRANSGL